MEEIIVHIIGKPCTKKNSQTMITTRGRPRLIQSKAYRRWEKEAELIYIKPTHTRKQIPIAYPVNCKATVFRERNVGDAINYWQAIADFLEKREVVVNDKFIVAWNGSECLKDKNNPRVEIVLRAYDEKFKECVRRIMKEIYGS